MHRIQDYLMKNSASFQMRFNPNLYTRVQMAQSSKLEEDKKNLADLANFIIKQSIPNLINEIVIGDIILPCDSKTLGELLHAHGINIRYLGKIISSFKREDYPYLNVLLERVMLSKSLKHYLKESFRNTAPMYHSEMIAHIFNCVFSSQQFINFIESDEGIKTLDQRSAELRDEDGEGEGKKKKKKKKNGPTKKAKDFDCFGSLLMQFSLVDMDPPEYNFVHLRPSQVWQRLREICQKRFLYTLPEKIDNFYPFKFKLTKLATLRDVCLSTGIILECKDYEITDEDDMITAAVAKPPFVPDNVIDMVPVIKHLDPICENAKIQIELTNKLIAENKLEEAMETLMGAVQIILNIFGPIHKDVAYCYAKMANLYFKLSDMNQAILYNKQSARVLEKLYGVDNPQTAHAYSTLALLYYTNKNHQKAFDYMLKSLYVFNTVGGEFHPEGAIIYSNLALMFQDAEKPQSAINCLFEALERNFLMYGLESFKVANSYQSLAIAHYDIHDYKKAIDYQEKSLEILRKILNPDDHRIKDSVTFLDKMRKSLEISLSPNVQVKKSQKKSPKELNEEEKEKIAKEMEELDDLDNLMKSKVEYSFSSFNGAQERERLLQRMKLAKLNAKYGFRKPGNLDYSKILQQYYMIGNPNHEETKSSTTQ